jgi:hypothetical protein
MITLILAQSYNSGTEFSIGIVVDDARLLGARWYKSSGGVSLAKLEAELGEPIICINEHLLLHYRTVPGKKSNKKN